MFVMKPCRGLVTTLEELETGFMIVFWRQVLNRFDENSANYSQLIRISQLLLVSMPL